MAEREEIGLLEGLATTRAIRRYLPEPIPEEDRVHEDSHQKGDLETHGLVDLMHDMNGFDELRLRKLVENHLHCTGSERARHILDNWDDYLPKFVKVMPVDYRRALLEMQTRNKDNDKTTIDVAVGD